MQAGNRIIFNTLVMYGRYLVSMVVTLFSSRWILLALGAEDFGIYSLVAGLLAMLLFLNMTMTSSTQRYLAFAAGKGDFKLWNETFYISILLHLLIGILIVLMIESVGVFMLHNVLQVPNGKMHLAEFTLHCLSVSTFFTVSSVPYHATLLTHENIVFISVIQITESLLKFASAIVLLSYSGSRLKLYALCMMAIPLLSMSVYRWYCKKNYQETRIKFSRNVDVSLIKQMLQFTGWNMIGGFGCLFRTQGVAMLMNSFFGVLVNAAYGIATQVNGQMQFFSLAIMTAARPQIVKNEGMGDRRHMLDLSKATCKFTFLLFLIVATPLIVKMPFILKIWLKEVPPYVVSFTRLVILANLVSQLTKGLYMAIESVGNIKYFQIFVNGLHFVVLPLGYIMLKFGMRPSDVLMLVVVEEIVGILISAFVAKNVTGIAITELVRDVLFPTFLIAFIALFGAYYLGLQINNDWLSTACITLATVVLVCVPAYFFALNENEKIFLRSAINSLQRRWRKK